jgi:hypothetical protein
VSRDTPQLIDAVSDSLWKLDDATLAELAAMLPDLIEKYGPTAKIKFEDEFDMTIPRIRFQRLETPEEVRRRLHELERQEARDREQYLRLKERFE